MKEKGSAAVALAFRELPDTIGRFQAAFTAPFTMENQAMASSNPLTLTFTNQSTLPDNEVYLYFQTSDPAGMDVEYQGGKVKFSKVNGNTNLLSDAVTLADVGSSGFTISDRGVPDTSSCHREGARRAGHVFRGALGK